MSTQPRWPKMLIGAVLLWRALVVGAFADSADVPDPRFLAEWSSPGLNRSVKLAFTSYYWDTDVVPAAVTRVYSSNAQANAVSVEALPELAL